VGLGCFAGREQGLVVILGFVPPLESDPLYQDNELGARETITLETHTNSFHFVENSYWTGLAKIAFA
jgi:hypothetical protein